MKSSRADDDALGHVTRTSQWRTAAHQHQGHVVPALANVG
jgi:hypothetical protein